MNKHDHFQDFVKIHNESDFFDCRENQGCTDEEIQSINKLIYPFKIPEIIQKYLKYCGKLYMNNHSFFNSILDAQNFKINQSLLQNKQFLILEYSEESSVQCGIKIEDLYLENPPYYTCETERSEDFYLLFDHFIGIVKLNELEESMIRRYIYFEENQLTYEIKQLIIEMYDLLEKESSFPEIKTISNKLRRFCCETYFISLSGQEANRKEFTLRLKKELSNQNLYVKSKAFAILKNKLSLKLNELL